MVSIATLVGVSWYVRKKMNQISLDLPRSELIGWIGHQLAGGYRSVPPPPSQTLNEHQLGEKLATLFETKKSITNSARSISEKTNALISESWRTVELKHSLLRLKAKDNRLNNEEAEALTVESEKVWGDMYLQLVTLAKQREQEEALMAASFKDPIDDSIANRRAYMLDDYLHERHLLKEQKSKREKLEKALRERIAKISAQLLAVKDLGRVKDAIDDSRRCEIADQIESSERQLEWQLMEEQIQLERDLRDVESRYSPRIARMQAEIVKLSEISKVESAFINEKSATIGEFKEEIAMLRQDAKDIETAVNQFRTLLRKEEKNRRDAAAKILRE